MKRIWIECIIVGLIAILTTTTFANPQMTDVIISEDSWGPFLIYKNLVETRIGSSPGAYGDWEIGIRTEAGGFAPVVSDNNYIWPNGYDPNSWLGDDPNSLFTLTFTKETGTIEFTLGYAPTLSCDCNDYAGWGMDKVYLMAKSDNNGRACTINELKVNGSSPDDVSELTSSNGQTYATIRGLDYEDFTLTGNIIFSYEYEAEHSEIEALFAFGTPGPPPPEPNETWTLVDKASIVDEGPGYNPWVARLKSIGDEAPPWASIVFTPPEPLIFDDANHLSADYNFVEGAFAGRSPRYEILVDWNDSHVPDEGDKLITVYWGTPSAYMDAPPIQGWYDDEEGEVWPYPGWYNTGNLHDCNDHRVNLSELGLPAYSTMEEAKLWVGAKDVFKITLVLDGGWLADQVLLVDNINIDGYLYDAQPTSSPVDIICDINGDGEVTMPDLMIMALHWMRDDCSGENCDNADIAPAVRDGAVNNIDFGVLADCWQDGVIPDMTPPDPNIMTWASEPNAIGATNSITMTATTATDESGVEYYFKNVTLPTHNSTWHVSPTYIDTELEPQTEYTYQVKARDLSPNKNETQYSPPASAVAQGSADAIEVEDIFIPVPPHDARLWDDGDGTGLGFDRDDSNYKALRLGDYNTNQGYRIILGFDTSSLPTDAEIISAKIQLTCGAKEGTSPFDGWGGTCAIDIASPYFGTSEDIEIPDWQSIADAYNVAQFTTDPGPENPIVSTEFNAAGLALINTYGPTQLRVRFTTPRSLNDRSDFLGFYSAEQEVYLDKRPQLIIRYTSRTPTLAIAGIEHDGRVYDDGAGVGEGIMDDTGAKALRLGDYLTNQSYRSIVTFDTSVFPENFSITGVMLKLAHGTDAGISPFNWGGTCTIDLAVPNFGTSEVLEPGDWEAPATIANVASFTSAPSDPNEGLYMVSDRFNADGRMNINLDGLTQFRVYFTNPTNTNGQQDFLGFYSEEAVETRKPKLLIEYSID